MKTQRTRAAQALIAACMVGLITITSAHAGDSQRYTRESVEVSDHYVFNTDERVNGATILVRNFRHREVHAHISSSALEPDTAYSVWWAIFNRPQYCATEFDCEVTDLEVFGGDPRVKASVFWAGGFVSSGSGTANALLHLTTGKTGRELFANTKNYGLKNLTGAEIHVVLRTHGPTGLAGPVARQIGSANEACPADTGCQNVFASIHVAGQ